MHILLVDDEELLRASLGYALSNAGFEVTAAADGLSALRLHREHPADVTVRGIGYRFDPDARTGTSDADQE